MHALRTAWSQVVTRRTLSRKKMTATDTTVLFVFGSKSFCSAAAIHCARLLCVDPSGRRRAGPGSIMHQHHTVTTSAGDYHTRLRLFLGGIAHRRSKKKQKSKKAKNSYGLHPSYPYFEHKAVERNNNEVLRNRNLFTLLQTRTSIRNERQWSLARIFLPTVAAIKFRATVSARSLLLAESGETFHIAEKKLAALLGRARGT